MFAPRTLPRPLDRPACGLHLVQYRYLTRAGATITGTCQRRRLPALLTRDGAVLDTLALADYGAPAPLPTVAETNIRGLDLRLRAGLSCQQ